MAIALIATLERMASGIGGVFTVGQTHARSQHVAANTPSPQAPRNVTSKSRRLRCESLIRTASHRVRRSRYQLAEFGR